MRSTACTVLLACLALAGCGRRNAADHPVRRSGHGAGPGGNRRPQLPVTATKNTTRVDGIDPVADAAGVALAVYPSSAPGPTRRVVTIAPTDDWQAALAASVLMAPPIRAPLLLSGSGSRCRRRPPAALKLLGADRVGRRRRSAGDPGGRCAEAERLQQRGDHRRRPVHAFGGDRPLLQRRPRRERSHQRRDRAREQCRVRDAGRGMGGRERRPDPVRQRLDSAGADRAGAPCPSEAPHLRARALERDPRQRPHAAQEVRDGQADQRPRSGHQLGRRSPSTATRPARTVSRAPTCPAASAGRCAARATDTC